MTDCKTCQAIVMYNLDKVIAKDHIINMVKMGMKREAVNHLAFLINAEIIKDVEHKVTKSFYKYGFYKVEVKSDEMVKVLEECI